MQRVAQAAGLPVMRRGPGLLLLGGACAACVVALASAPAAEGAPAPAAVAVSATRTSPDARTFTVRLNAGASQVVVCDVQPLWCAPASRTGRLTWTAVLPTGPLPSSGPSDATDLRAGPHPERIAGGSATFEVAVLARSRSGAIRRRSFSGDYRAAAASRPARPLG